MKHLDYEGLLNKYHKKIKVNLTILIIILCAYVGLFVLGILISTFENKKLIMIIFSIVLGLLSCFMVGFLIFGVIDYRKKEKQLIFILSGYLTIVEGTIGEIKGQLTSISGRKGIEILIVDGDEQTIVYYDSTFGQNPFSEGQKVHLEISGSFIVNYEVQNG